MPIQHSNYFSIGGLIFSDFIKEWEKLGEEKKRKGRETKNGKLDWKYKEKKDRKQRKNFVLHSALLLPYFTFLP